MTAFSDFAFFQSFFDEIHPGDSLTDKLLQAFMRRKVSLRAGDILIVKHKIVSKAEGRLVELDKVKPSASSRTWARRYHLDARVTQVALAESQRVVRRKRGVLITETRHGLVCANSGVDVSNVNGGRHALLLPKRSGPIRCSTPSRTEKSPETFHSRYHH